MINMAVAVAVISKEVRILIFFILARTQFIALANRGLTMIVFSLFSELPSLCKNYFAWE